MAAHPFLSQRSIDRLVRRLAERRAAAAEMAEAFSAEARDAGLTADHSDLYDVESPIGTCNDESFALAANAAAIVSQIDEAFLRMDAGTYGFCRACGDPIPYRRLAAVPATSLCLDCCRERRTAAVGRQMAGVGS